VAGGEQERGRAAGKRKAAAEKVILTTQPELHYLGHRKRLRERFIKAGLDGFADYEVVELLLTLAIPRSDVKRPAKALIERFGNVRAILDAPLDELRQVKGIGSVAPVALRIIRAAATLYLQQRAEGTELDVDQRQLEMIWRARIGALRDEVFEVAYLDSGHRLMRDGIERLEEGTIDRAAVYPRRVVESALRRGAAALVLAHNHPNGQVDPTEQDKVLTRALVLAAETVGVKIVDHLVVSADAVFSFRKAGLL
jgi:DNA repair protein RadC